LDIVSDIHTCWPAFGEVQQKIRKTSSPLKVGDEPVMLPWPENFTALTCYSDLLNSCSGRDVSMAVWLS
jgi:hypothetical protein